MIKICDMTSRSYFGKMNSTLGSVVPLAMFATIGGKHKKWHRPKKWYQKIAQEWCDSMSGHLSKKQHKFEISSFLMCPLKDFWAIYLNLYLTKRFQHYQFSQSSFKRNVLNPKSLRRPRGRVGEAGYGGGLHHGVTYGG